MKTERNKNMAAQLTCDDKVVIACLLKEKVTIPKIARKLVCVKPLSIEK